MEACSKSCVPREGGGPSGGSRAKGSVLDHLPTSERYRPRWSGRPSARTSVLHP